MRNGLALLMVGLLLSSCGVWERGHRADPFAGDWQGSGVDSEGNAFTFAATVTALGDGRYRMLVLDKLDTQKEPLHVMDGVFTNGEFPYTADQGAYTGNGRLKGDTFEGWYKGPVDGTFTMHKMGKR